MRNLLRAAAACALALTALSTVEAQTYGRCRIYCAFDSGPPFYTIVNATTTQGGCCGADVSQYCPPGSTGSALSWNTQNCLT